MSLAIDPIISNLFFSLSLIPHMTSPQIPVVIKTTITQKPYVSVLITLYKEYMEDINMTITSLIAQTYPKENFEVIMIVEQDDETTKRHVYDCHKNLQRIGISSKVIQSDGKKRLKPYALNIGLRYAEDKYCAFYDTSDYIEPDQIQKAISLLEEKNKDVVQATVLRYGNSLLSRFLFFDTLLWYRKYLPVTLHFAEGIPLSGEGLFIRTDVLKEVRYFPEVITEDAAMGLLLTEKNKNFGLLDSIVIEKAPLTTKSHITQKSRWYRGYIVCLRRLIDSDLPMKKKFFFFLLFVSPITSSLAFIGLLLLLCNVFFQLILPHIQLSAPWMATSIYQEFLSYWSFLLAFVGIPLWIISYAHTLTVHDLSKCIPWLVFVPVYWFFVGLCAFVSFFRGTKNWGKTIR